MGTEGDGEAGLRFSRSSELGSGATGSRGVLGTRRFKKKKAFDGGFFVLELTGYVGRVRIWIPILSLLEDTRATLANTGASRP